MTARDHSEAYALDRLLQRAARHDEAAFSALYDRVSSRVYGLILRVLRDPAQSEEVAQEVFLDVWHRADRFDPHRGSAVTWILTIAHRRAVDRVRSEQSHRDRLSRAEAGGAVPAFDVVAATIEDRAERERVRQALAALTDLQRQAIELAYYGGYTYREVAEMLGAPLGTVKTRMRDGLQRLQAALDER